VPRDFLMRASDVVIAVVSPVLQPLLTSPEVIMPLTATDPTFADPTLVVVPWYDEVVDPIGHDPRSQYVELFWLNVLGPTTTWLLRRLVGGLDQYPGGYELDLEQTAKALGLGYTFGTVSPFTRALQRCVLFGVAHTVDGGLAVRRRLPEVSQRQLARMPDYLRQAHRTWRRTPLSAAVGDASHAQVCERAQVLADAMAAVGDDPDVIERQLLGLGVPPTVAFDAMIAAVAAGTPHDAPEAA
jgi:hypothetical protein